MSGPITPPTLANPLALACGALRRAPSRQEALQSLSGQVDLEADPGRAEPESGERPPVVTPPPPIEGIATNAAAAGEAGDGPSLSDLEDGAADSDAEGSETPARNPGRAEGMGAPFGLHL